MIFDYDYFYARYEEGSYTKEMLWNIVRIKKLTEAEYKLITGDDYPAICPPKEKPVVKPIL